MGNFGKELATSEDHKPLNISPLFRSFVSTFPNLFSSPSSIYTGHCSLILEQSTSGSPGLIKLSSSSTPCPIYYITHTQVPASSSSSSSYTNTPLCHDHAISSSHYAIIALDHRLMFYFSEVRTSQTQRQNSFVAPRNHQRPRDSIAIEEK